MESDERDFRMENIVYLEDYPSFRARVIKAKRLKNSQRLAKEVKNDN